MLLTVPLSLLTAITLFLLNELLKFAVAVLPLLAAAEPWPSAEALPSLLRLSPLSVVVLVLVVVLVSVSVLVVVLVLVLVEVELSRVALEYSFACGPAPLWVEFAVAVCVFESPFTLSLLMVGFAKADPKAIAMAVARMVCFMKVPSEVVGWSEQ
jgi:hypothetical protein